MRVLHDITKMPGKDKNSYWNLIILEKINLISKSKQKLLIRIDIVYINNISDDVENKPVELQISVESSLSENERLTAEFRASASEITETAISIGEMYVDGIKPGSVILLLRPVTEQAANELLNAKKNNRLLEMVLKMLEHTDLEKRVDVSKPLKIKVQVWYASSTKPKQGE